MQITIAAKVAVYEREAMAELKAILHYWITNTLDDKNGGFVGRIDETNLPYPEAAKGAVLNSRILWAFAASYKITNDAAHLEIAGNAFNYLKAHFIDKKNGGVYWTVDAQGQPLDTKKQIYALAFALYGCCAYFEISDDIAVKLTAIELFEAIEKYSFDKQYTGYMEAFTTDWQTLPDLRLSDKDANEKKTMNTHLHVLEAYTTLYNIWPDEKLKQQLIILLGNFTDHFVDLKTGHLNLFFDEKWNPRAPLISYGHDIEAAWLLVRAATVVNDKILIEKLKNLSVKIATAAVEGLDIDGGMWYEYEPETNHLIKEKHWWVQAEAMVGFFGDWQISGKQKSLDRSLACWNYVKDSIKDKNYGEWLWGRNENDEIMQGQDKVGLWKCPYHNARACIEIINRIESLK